jgi:uncharacterized protein (DUF2384 family)
MPKRSDVSEAALADPPGADPVSRGRQLLADAMAADHAAPAAYPDFLAETAAILGGDPVLGHGFGDLCGLHHAIVGGLPAAVLTALAEAGLSADELDRIAPAYARDGHLSVMQSDLAVRYARLVAMADHVLRDRDAALAWLRTPKRSLAGRSPFEAAASHVGFAMAADLLQGLAMGDLS